MIEYLKEIREHLFTKLGDDNPSLTDQELCHRRKKKLILDDIYVIGYSLINGLEDRRVRNLLKSDHTKENDTLNKSDIDGEVNPLIQICAELKTTCNKLTSQVKSLETRILVLESELNEVKLLQAQKSPQKKASDDVLRSVAVLKPR